MAFLTEFTDFSLPEISLLDEFFVGKEIGHAASSRVGGLVTVSGEKRPALAATVTARDHLVWPSCAAPAPRTR